MHSRFARWLPAAVFFLAVAGTFSVAQGQGMGKKPRTIDPNVTGPQRVSAPLADSLPVDEVVCPNCQTAIAFESGSPPTKCPKCGTAITHIVNPDGSRTSTGATDTDKNPYKLIAFGVGGVVLLLALIMALVKLATGGGKTKKGKKARRKAEDDAEDE